MPLPLLNDNELYDFLYVDRIRLAAFAAQLLEHGDKRQTRLQFGKQTSTDSKGGSDLKILKYEESATTTSNSLVEHLIDTQWLTVLDILQHMHDAGMIATLADDRVFGRILHLRGLPDLVDFRILKPVWQDCIEAALSAQQGGKPLSKSLKDVAALGGRIMTALPHSLSLTLASGGHTFWGSLHPEFMVAGSDQILLRHGCQILELWDCIGVIDTFAEGKKPEEDSLFNAGQEAAAGVRTILKGLREMFGRPYTAHGIVPLLIFRRLKTHEDLQETVSPADQPTA